MSGLCKDCKFWAEHIFGEYHFCARLLSDRNETNYASGSDDGAHWLVCGPEFGCEEFREGKWERTMDKGMM